MRWQYDADYQTAVAVVKAALLNIAIHSFFSTGRDSTVSQLDSSPTNYVKCVY